MAKKKKQNLKVWLLMGLAGSLLAAPNATIIRSVVTTQDEFLFNVLRFGVIALICLPFLIPFLRKFRRKNLKYTIISALFMAVSVTMNVLAIKAGTASYVSIITLITPIIMLILSVRIIGDTITPRAVAGMSLASVGAMVTILLPIAIHQGSSFVFYPLATLFALINAVSFPLSTIYYRKANENGVPFMPLMGLAAIFVVITNLVMYSFLGSKGPVDYMQMNWPAIIYSGVAVAFLARTLNMICYERLGAVTISTLSYVGSFFAILIPVVVLGERLSLTMIIGGILMFAGVYVVEAHKFKHHKHFYKHVNH